MWAGIILKKMHGRLNTRALVTVIISFGVLCRVLFVLFTPTFYAPDEGPHYEYINYLVQNRSLPVATEEAIRKTYNCEYMQPPLYYLVLAPICAGAQMFIEEETTIVCILRMFSIVLWGLTMWITFKIIERLKITDEFVRIFIVSMMSLLPSYVSITSVINNDNLFFLIGSIFLYHFISLKYNVLYFLLIGFILGLGMLSKFYGGLYFILLGVIFAIYIRHPKQNFSKLALIALSCIIAGIMVAPWLMRNHHFYGTINPVIIVTKVIQSEPLFQALKITGEYIHSSFWAVSGIFNNVHWYYPRIGKIISVLAVGGFLWGVIFRRHQLVHALGGRFEILVAFMVAIIANLLLDFRYGVLFGQGQGRYLFALLAPIALFMGGGLRMYSLSSSKHAPIVTAGIFSVYALSFTIFCIGEFGRLVP